MSRRRSSKSANMSGLRQFFRDYPIILLVVIVFSVGLASGYVFGRRSVFWRHTAGSVFTSQAFKNAAIAAPISAAPLPIPAPKAVRENHLSEKVQIPRERKAEPAPIQGSVRKPRIAFVIDDIGYNKKYADLLFSVNRPITFSILPELAYSEYFAEEAKKRGFETILHLPLEPEDHEADPGPGKITVDMKANQIKSIIEKNLATVPGVTGVNNHMGSRATRDRGLMYLVLKELKRKNLFFLDSLTHPESAAHDVAFAIGMPALKRDVFLDNIDDPDYIKERIEEAAQIAKGTGQAVAIGHVRENTIAAIKNAVPRLESEGFEISSLKDLM